MGKSYVGMECRVCHVCGNTYETGGVLLDRRLQNSLERRTVVGMGLCPKHYKEGYICLIEVDGKKSKIVGGKINTEDAYRTGTVCHVKKEAFCKIFNFSEFKGDIVYVDEEVIAKIQALSVEEKKEEYDKECCKAN